jgi:glycerophosphoryl diester phosphodiesterase
VFDLSADELARLDATWADGTTLDGASALPALADVAALLFDHPELTLLLELRRESLERFGAGSVVGRVREALRGVRSQCVLVSRDLGAINVAREHGAARVGWILPGYDAHTRLKYEALRPDFLLIEAAALPPPPARLWRGPWRWVVLGVNRAAEAEALAARGADFVATGAVGPLSAELRARSRPA